MWRHTDNQEVSLEAATLERKRNSSLVKWLRAEDITGLKLSTEAADATFWGGVVGERSSLHRSMTERRCGAAGSENADVSND